MSTNFINYKNPEKTQIKQSLMDHNQQTLEQVEAFTSQGKDCCVVNPCGSGKTSVMAAFIKRHPDKSFLVFTKQKNAKEYYKKRDSVFFNTHICTYAKMRDDYRNGRIENYKADYYMVDEAHYLGASKWGEAFDFLRKNYSPIIIGFTATAQRFENQGTAITIVDDYFDGNSAGNFTSHQLQKRGVFQEPEYVLSLYDMRSVIEDKLDKLELSDISEQFKKKYSERLIAALNQWEQKSCPEKVMSEVLPKFMYKDECNKILVFVSRIADIPSKAKNLTAILNKVFSGKKISSYRYTHEDPESNFNEFIKEDKNYIKVLYSVDKIMETVHIDDLNIAIMLRPSVSDRIITQQFGRMNNIGNPNRPLIIDMVDNLSNLGSINFANVGMGKTPETKAGSRFNLNLSYISLYTGLFDAIDKITSRSERYTIDGFTGSLSQICDIYGKNLAEVKGYNFEGYELEEALKKAHTRTKHHMSQEIFDDIVTFKDFELDEESKSLAEKHIPTVERFIRSRNITDEDVIQELYMEMLFRVSNAKDKAGYISTYIVNGLSGRYCKIFRDKVMRKTYMSSKNLASLENTANDHIDLSDRFLCKDFEENFDDIIKERLTEKEYIVIQHRFGLHGGPPETLEEVGKIFGVCKDRIRQIEAKSLNKLKRPFRIQGSIAQRFADILETYDAL